MCQAGVSPDQVLRKTVPQELLLYRQGCPRRLSSRRDGEDDQRSLAFMFATLKCKLLDAPQNSLAVCRAEMPNTSPGLT